MKYAIPNYKCNYLTDNCINELAKFSPNIWAFSFNTSERTTNSCESFHTKLNSLFTKSHPNIYLFTNMLNTKIQTDTYIILRSINKQKLSKNIIYLKQKKIEGFLNDYDEKNY